MNMGGGILLRTVGRAAGSTTPAASTAVCSACTGQVPRPSSLRTICRACQNTTLSHQAVGTVNPSEFEELEFVGDFVSDNVNRTWPAQATRRVFSPTTSVSSLNSVCDDPSPSDNQNYWHVFGLPPTFDEAYAAASDLQAAFFESDTHAIDDDIKSLEHIPQASNEGSDSEQESHSGEWVEPQLLSSNRVMVQVPKKAMVQVPKSSVHEAFRLLQNDSNVKAAVIAIAQDADVWHAMLRNKKVQELKRIFEEKSQGTEEVDTSPMHSKDENDDPSGGLFSVFHAIGEMSGRFVCRVQDDLSRFIMSLFSLLTGADSRSEKEGPIDKAVASTMMLGVLVVAVVIVKRLPV